MKKNKPASRTLRLTAETIRALNDRSLEGVAGGLLTLGSCGDNMKCPPKDSVGCPQ